MKTYMVTLSDDDVERLRVAAAARQQTPEEALQATVEEAIHAGRFTISMGPVWSLVAPTEPISGEDPMTTVMRDRGHLVSAPIFSAPAGVEIPPYGSPEFDAALEEIGDEASDALEQMGLNIIDLVER